MPTVWFHPSSSLFTSRALVMSRLVTPFLLFPHGGSAWVRLILLASRGAPSLGQGCRIASLNNDKECASSFTEHLLEPRS